MKQKHFFIFLDAILALCIMGYAIAQPPPANQVQSNKRIEATTAGGEKEMTIIDADGNLKIVESPKPGPVAQPPPTQGAPSPAVIPPLGVPGAKPPMQPMQVSPPAATRPAISPTTNGQN